MPQYTKLDIFKVTERRSHAVYKTKRVGYHWFEVGKTPETYTTLSAELVKQNGLPEGEYMYVSTSEYVIEARCPQGRII